MMAKEAPKAAPCAIPKVDADARGFFKRLCMAQPTVANPIPATMAVTTLGKRWLKIIMADCLFPYPNKVAITSCKERPAEPALIAHKAISVTATPISKMKSFLERI